MQGHHIRTLASGAHPPGNYRYYWNGVDKRGQSKSSGTYVVSLSSGSDMYTQQIILLR
jgi:flagellar hook assembly protein FlgD